MDFLQFKFNKFPCGKFFWGGHGSCRETIFIWKMSPFFAHLELLELLKAAKMNKQTNEQTYKQTDGLTNKWKNGDKELSLDKITWRKIQSWPNFLAQPRFEVVSVAPRIARSPLSKPFIQAYYEMTNA